MPRADQSSVNPSPGAGQQSASQPPSAQDYELFRAVRVLGQSAWNLAPRFKLSVSGVRQIVSQVEAWLAQALPVQSDVQQEQERRLT